MAMLRVWVWDVDLDSALDFMLWSLPLLLVACLIIYRIIKGGPLDPVTDPFIATAAVVTIVNIIARRLKPHCFWRR